MIWLSGKTWCRLHKMSNLISRRLESKVGTTVASSFLDNDRQTMRVCQNKISSRKEVKFKVDLKRLDMRRFLMLLTCSDLWINNHSIIFTTSHWISSIILIRNRLNKTKREKIKKFWQPLTKFPNLRIFSLLLFRDLCQVYPLSFVRDQDVMIPRKFLC